MDHEENGRGNRRDNALRAFWGALILIVLAAPLAHAAQVSGTVYTQDLNVARYSLLTIDTVPPQRIILEDGEYNVTLPAGKYQLRAFYSENDKVFEDNVTMTIDKDGVYTYDFILFPSLPSERQELPVMENITLPEPSQPTIPYNELPTILLIVLLVALALLLGSKEWWRRSAWKRRSDGAARSETAAAQAADAHHAGTGYHAGAEQEERHDELPADLQSIITMLKREDGRTTQKELRRHIPCSEAKMSMMLTELEHKGKIARIKKGRGNLIILKR